MNGPHDLGGSHGFGPVVVEQDEPVFHADWERRIFGVTMTALCRGVANLDELRHARERVPPAQYLASSYYENWVWAMETLLVEKGVVGPAELVERRKHPVETFTAGRRDDEFLQLLLAIVHKGGSMSREAPEPPRFAVDEVVVARNVHPTGHTRLPGYVRGKAGAVVRVHGAFPLPDANAHGGDRADYLYTVRFDGGELWGESAEPGTSVSIDLYESYLRAAA